MMKVLASLCLLAVIVQTPPVRHDKYKDDPHAYCLQGKPLPTDKHGHECHCTFTCQGDKRVETNECELWCTLSRCVCFPEKRCP